jgi:predicted LPLAT superfamily acyltransferase
MTHFNPCFIIPNYNHAEAFAPVVDKLVAFKLPIIVVDDGSNQSTGEALKKIEKQYELVTLHQLEKNQGKGGAVMAGMRLANIMGFSHGLQLDADGQHNLADIESFLSKAKALPESLICGYPVYDESVPLGRLIPRYITHFWVWIETLSFAIKDSMCGFRVYPLAKVIAVIDQANLGKRMDFDIEILVRLYWHQVNLEFTPTKVIYPQDGLSHFKLWQDNWLITKMHTRLFFGMLFRLPKLIKNNHNRRKQRRQLHWSVRRERGTPLGLNILVWSYKVFGRGAFKLLLRPVIAYFTLFAGETKQASIQYQQKMLAYKGQTGNIGWRQVYAHFYQFGLAAIDKIGSWMGDIQEKNVIIHNDQVNDEIANSGKGAIFIGSHLGNLELSRAIGQNRKGLVINAVVFNKHALNFQEVLNQSNPDTMLNLIHVESVGSDTAILLKQKVDQGEVVIIVGDRTSVNSIGRVEYVDFLGSPAPFSQGPFVLAGILDCPVYLIFCIKEQQTYNVYLEPFRKSMKLPRKNRQEQLRVVIQEYADRLAFYAQKAPLQWFNFFDFWHKDDEKSVVRNRNEKSV